MSQRPLEGKIVLDLTTALAGPYATLLLAGLGARVIKIENPERGGDAARNNSPYVTPGGLSVQRTSDEDMSVSMLSRGRNKESITLDLKDPRGRQVFLDLAARADIVVENYSAGVTERLGIDYGAVVEANPRLVYTSISGFGSQGGPGTGKAMDTIIQALSGVMMTAGSPGDAPIRFGLPIGDLVAPLFAVIGTLSAVIQAESTGRGQHVDVSMLGALTSMVAAEPFDAFEMIGLPTRTGALVPRLAPFGTFEAEDGYFAICAPTDGFAHGVLTAIGRSDLIADPKFARRDGRVHNADQLHAMIGQWAADKPVAKVISELESNGAPCAEVRTPRDAVRDPIVVDRGEVVPLIHPTYGNVVELFGSGLPITMSESETSLERPAPALGEHTAQVLAELLDYDQGRIAELAESHVL
ncbi:CaiB/BaiF CoA transferase family protein [Rhodococcus jostii]|uniref:Crotonobetainyl-CoA:carnitine CoA-transferase CaiB n=1 Tax=Rhodococcus jostii TaxID=132919 RepID=A0A1H5DKT3_RHOJO|nr:CoA transferase [Rhodococcus jostii]SED79407.1 Crotonobetainyl-CoA:carnitine CoA-transferase CaiB [Rhodococcus jostii]